MRSQSLSTNGHGIQICPSHTDVELETLSQDTDIKPIQNWIMQQGLGREKIILHNQSNPQGALK